MKPYYHSFTTDFIRLIKIIELVEQKAFSDFDFTEMSSRYILDEQHDLILQRLSDAGFTESSQLEEEIVQVLTKAAILRI